MTRRSIARHAGSIVALFAGFLIASEARSEIPTVGSVVPDLELVTIDDERLTLSNRDGATILVFFRGAW